MSMSMEALLDEERREVLALLEGSNNRTSSYGASSPTGGRSASPYTSPRSPIRSMLGVAEHRSSSVASSTQSPTRQAPVRSMLDIDTVTAAPLKPVRSMLDVEPGPISPKPTPSVHSSSSESTIPSHGNHHPRSFSDSSSHPLGLGPRGSTSQLDPTGYQFGNIITANPGQQLPKRNTQGGKAPPSKKSSALAEVMRSGDTANLIIPGERGRHHSIAGPTLRLSAGNKSRSPHSRLAMRSNSPHASLLSSSAKSSGGVPNLVILDNGRMVDISSAYRRLSDANLAMSGGRLGEMAVQKMSHQQEDGRLAKDYYGPDGEELQDSSDDHDGNSSDDEPSRGRQKNPRSLPEIKEGISVDNTSPTSERERKTMTLLAAAEEERVQVASQRPYKYRSLFDEPEITVTDPYGEKHKANKSGKPGIRPNTSYEQGISSGAASANNSEDEADVNEIMLAQRLSVRMTPIITSPEHGRSIQIIHRGEYTKIAQATKEEQGRLRDYLVATDLSEESTHALEWAIGTVLRDGDTLIAMYCVDEETGIVTGDDDAKESSFLSAAGSQPKSGMSLTSISLPGSRMSSISAAAGDSGSNVSSSPSPSGQDLSKADEERKRAVEDITNRVTKLLRKTRLQVRVIVEVLHCKSPKHMIMEIIDLINPTLVILGSRGRSALKGVILGSFSNYLVTKSSVPVMVARKRLRKQNKYKRSVVRQVNNLSNPSVRSLANAKVD